MNEVFTIIGYVASAAFGIMLLGRLLGKEKKDNSLVDVHQPEDHQVAMPQNRKTIVVTHNLTPVQEVKLTFLFNLFDFNRNGYLQRDDIVNIAENMSIIKAETLKDHHLSSVRKFMEKSWVRLTHAENELYEISLAEWLHFTDKEIVNCSEEIYRQNIERLVRSIFLFFDDNHDKYLNLREYMSLLVSFRADFRSAKKSFEMLDVNQDGLISAEELSHAVWAFFHSSDPDEKGNWLFGEWKPLDWEMPPSG